MPKNAKDIFGHIWYLFDHICMFNCQRHALLSSMILNIGCRAETDPHDPRNRAAAHHLSNHMSMMSMWMQCVRYVCNVISICVGLMQLGSLEHISIGKNDFADFADFADLNLSSLCACSWSSLPVVGVPRGRWTVWTWRTVDPHLGPNWSHVNSVSSEFNEFSFQCGLPRHIYYL